MIKSLSKFCLGFAKYAIPRLGLLYLTVQIVGTVAFGTILVLTIA